MCSVNNLLSTMIIYLHALPPLGLYSRLIHTTHTHTHTKHLFYYSGTSIPLATRLALSTSSPYHCRGCNTTRLKRDLESSLTRRADVMLPCARSGSCTVSVDSVECGHQHHRSKVGGGN